MVSGRLDDLEIVEEGGQVGEDLLNNLFNDEYLPLSNVDQNFLMITTKIIR